MTEQNKTGETRGLLGRRLLEGVEQESSPPAQGPTEEQELSTSDLRYNIRLLEELVRQGGTKRRFTHGRLLGVAGTAVPFPAFTCDFGVILKAEDGNADMVYIGDQGVTNVVAPGGGFELDANQGIIIPIRLLSELFMYDVPGNQIISYFAM